MRRIALFCALAVLLTAPASGQEWTEYQNVGDGLFVQAIGWLDKDGKGIRYTPVPAR